MLNWPLCFLIALRYARTNRKKGVGNFIVIFTILGITIGVSALILVVSVMDGFEQELKNRILGAVPHVSVHKRNASISEIELITKEIQVSKLIKQQVPLTESAAIMQVPNNLVGVLLQGISEKEHIPSQLEQSIFIGDWQAMFEQKYGVIIGYQLANKYGLSVGDKVRLLLSGASHYTPIGRLPAQRNFTVVGIFQTGSEAESQTAFVNAVSLNKLLKRNAFDNDGIKIMLHDAFNADLVANRLTANLDDHFDVTIWKQTHGNLFSAVKMEKNMMAIMLMLVILVAAFNMISALVMMVTQKQAEIAILKTQGLSSKNLLTIFIVQGSYSGAVGTFWGVTLGVALTLGLNPFMQLTGIQLLGPVGFGIPVMLSWSKVVVVTVITLLLALLSSIYPAIKASNVQPANALRHE